MANAKVLTGSSRIKQNVRQLRDQWLITEATWNDSVRKRFEDRYLAPLDSAVDAAVFGMQKLSDVLDMVRRDCYDRSDSQ